MATALITGASSGIGREIAIALSRRGYDIINVSRRPESKEGGMPTHELVSGRYIELDLSEKYAASVLVKKLKDIGAMLDVVVHNAGFMRLDKYDSRTFEKQVNVSLRFPYFFTLESIANRIVSPGACHVFISSISGVVGEPDDVIYGAVKAGMVAMAKGFAKKFQDYRFFAVSPGLVGTHFLGDPDSIPKELREANLAKRYASPKEIAYLVVALISNWFVNATNVIVDGGQVFL